MKNIKEVSIDNEVVYLKKDFLGWHTTNPIKNNDGTINWKNLISGGSWIKLCLVIAFVIIMIMAIVEYTESLRYCSELIANQSIKINPNFLNISNLNITLP